MDTNIRALKANLSGLIRRVEGGETLTVSVHNRRVARIVPVANGGSLKELARLPGLVWRGGKPRGFAQGERLPRGAALADRVLEDRR